MKFNSNEDFNKQITKLLALLRKMLKSQKIDGKDMSELFNKKDINVNVSFFTFFPFSMDEMEDLDLDEFSEEGLSDILQGNEMSAEQLKFEINRQDEDFLRKHGIKF